MAQRKANATKAAEAAETAVTAPGEGMTGFAVLDNKGRLSLSKPVRQALGMRPGSTLAYVVVNGGLLLIPQDEQLAALLDHAAAVLAGAGLTAQDVLDELPAARAAVVEELYGAEFMGELARQHEALRARERDSTPDES